MFIISGTELSKLTAGAQKELRTGSTVRITVLRKSGSDSYFIKIGSTTIHARSKIPLKEGQHLLSTAVWKGRMLELRPFRNTALHAGRYSSFAGKGNLEQTLLSSFIRAKLPLKENRMQYFADMFKKMDNPQDTVRLFGLLLEKFPKANNQSLMSMLRGLQNPEYRISDAEEQDRENSDNKDESYNQNSSSEDNNNSDSGSENSNKEKNKQQYTLGFGESPDNKLKMNTPSKEILFKRIPEGKNVLQYFNHVHVHDPSWVMFPFQEMGGEKKVDGSLRMLYNKKRSTIDKTVIHVYDGSANWYFVLYGNWNHDIEMSIYCDRSVQKESSKRKLSQLKENLTHMGINLDDTIKEGQYFDGADEINASDLLPSIDTRV